MRGSCGRDCMVVGLTTTYAISAYHHLSCKFESRSGEVYLIQHYVTKFVSDLRQVGGFLRVLRVSSTINTDNHDITKILLKVVLNTMNLTLSSTYKGGGTLLPLSYGKLYSYLSMKSLSITIKVLLYSGCHPWMI